jgi:hypothetical protein
MVTRRESDEGGVMRYRFDLMAVFILTLGLTVYVGSAWAEISGRELMFIVLGNAGGWLARSRQIQ